MAKFCKPTLVQGLAILRFEIGLKEIASEAGILLWNMIELIPNTKTQEDAITDFVVSMLYGERDGLIRRELNAQAIITRAQFFRVFGGISLKRRLELIESQLTDARRFRTADMILLH